MDLLNIIKEYWSILAFIGTVIISWVKYDAKNKAQDVAIKSLKERIEENEKKNDKEITELKHSMEKSNKAHADMMGDIKEIKAMLTLLIDGKIK